MKIVALVPLRGGSKSIPKKNIKLLAGLPLAAWVLKAAVNASKIDEVYVSTDSDEISKVVGELGLNVKFVQRPKKFATDEATTESVMLHFLNEVDFDLLVTIQATSPLLTSFDLDTAIDEFISNNLDSLLTAVRSKRFFWNDNSQPLNYDPLYRPRRQEFPGTLMENGAFYITKKDILSELKCRLGGNIGIYEMDQSSAVEIDEPDDWSHVEKILFERINN